MPLTAVKSSGARPDSGSIFDLESTVVSDAWASDIAPLAGLDDDEDGRSNSRVMTAAGDTPSSIANSGSIAPDVVMSGGSNIVFHNTYSSGVTAAYHQAVRDAET